MNDFLRYCLGIAASSLLLFAPAAMERMAAAVSMAQTSWTLAGAVLAKADVKT